MIIVYGVRVILMFLVTWLGLRILGKKSIAQITTFDLAGILLLTTVAAEPLVYKIPTKATEGVLIIAILTLGIGKLSLRKDFYNIDMQPSIIIINGKVDKNELKKNNMNLPFLLSQLRLKGYAKVSDIEYAIVEPNGNISVIPKSQYRPVQPNDLKIQTKYEGLSLPLIIDGEIQYQNLKYASLDVKWLNEQINKQGAQNAYDVFLAELDSQGNVYVDLLSNKINNHNNMPPIF